jgi:hypothetical protein
MDPSIKSLTITGSAAEDATKSRQKATRKKRPTQEEETEFIEEVKKHTKILPKPSVPIVPKPTPVEPIVPPTTPVSEQKVILKPPKQLRVKLQPKAVHQHVEADLSTTRKARRIKLNVSNLNHRFTRAKRLKDDTEKKSMDTVRQYLIERGVIQTKSKAPEKMLRSMYSDFMLLKDQAL